MVSLMLPSLLMFISLSMALPSNDGHLQEPTLKRLARNVGQQRHFHQLIDKVLEHEKNNLHQTDGAFALKIFEDSACLEACYKCVEDYPTTARKKKGMDNCGPMCDCADSCSRMPIEKVNQLYGQGNANRADKDCFWRTYSEVLKNELSSLSKK